MATIQQILADPAGTMKSWSLPQQRARLKTIQHLASTSISLDQARAVVQDCGLRHLNINGQPALHVITALDYSKGLSEIANCIFLEDTKLCEEKDSEDRSCLHLAAALGSQEWIDFFINLNMSYDLKTASGDTLLHSACKGNTTEVIIGKFPSLKDVRNAQLQTPLHFLAGNTQIKDEDIHVRCVKGLISDQKALIKTDSYGHTPLHIAVASGNYRLLKHLNTTNVDYLELAKLSNHPKTLKWCLEKYNRNQTPFNSALENGMDVQATALYAGEHMSEDTFIKAVDKGMKKLTLAMLNAQVCSTKAYHGAAKHGWCDVLKRLEAMRWQKMPWYERLAENTRWAIGRPPSWDVPIKGKRPLDLATDQLTRSYLKSLGCQGDLEGDWHIVEKERLDEWTEISTD